MPYDLSACGQVTICSLVVGYGNNTITTGNDGGGVYMETGGNIASRSLRIQNGDATFTNYSSVNVSGLSQAVYFNTNSTERMRIASGGNVGIGTSSPASRLTVAGDVGIGSCIGSSTYSGPSQYGAITFPRAQMLFSNTNPQSQFYFVSNGSLNASSQFTYTSTGKAGKINIDDGSISLDVASSAAAGCVISWINGITIPSTGNIGVNTTSPAGKMHISHTGAEGACALILQSTNGCGNGTIAWRSSAGTTQAQIGSNYNVADSAGNLEFITTASTRLLITSAGCVGVGTTTPSYRLHVNGTFYAAGSSQDYKQGICNYNTDSCMFMKLKPVTYQYKEEYCHLGKELKSGTQIGLIAEEVAESHPELAILVNEEDEKVVRNVDYEKLTIILLSELQKLRQEVDQLKNK
jgi:hypothetical protein